MRRVIASFFVASVLGVSACGGAEPPAKPPAAREAPKDPPWMADATRACALVGSCPGKPRDPGACIESWVSRGNDVLAKCLTAAKDCHAIDACYRGGGDAKAAAFCGEKGIVSGCDGERLVACADDVHEASVVDCGSLGGTCTEQRVAGGIVLRGCLAPAKCPPSAPETRCEGNAVVACQKGAVERTACGPGTECSVGSTGEAVCALAGGKACGVAGARRCEAGRLVACNGAAATITDCAAMGLDCMGMGFRASCAVKIEPECNKDMLPKCEGNALVYCAAGRLVKVSCPSLGFGACDPAARGPKAACAPAPAK